MNCINFVCYSNSIRLDRLLSDLNSSTTVERYRRQSLYTTIALSRNLSAVNAHLNELVSHLLGTALRQPLVVIGSTCCAVSVTINEEVVVVLNSVLGQSANVNQILLRSNLGLVKVEEYRNRSGNEFLHRLTHGVVRLRNVSKLVLQVSNLVVSIAELSIESVELRLVQVLESLHIGHLVPTNTTNVEGQTNLASEPTVVV